MASGGSSAPSYVSQRISAESLPPQTAFVYVKVDFVDDASVNSSEIEIVEVLVDPSAATITGFKIYTGDDAVALYNNRISSYDLARNFFSHGQDAPISGKEDMQDHWFESLAVLGYRGFASNESLQFARPNGQPGSGLTIVVGANSSGKSTVIEALHYFSMASVGTQISFPTFTRNSTLDNVSLTLQSNLHGILEVKTLTQGTSIAEAKIPQVEHSGLPQVEVFVTPSRRSFSPFFGDSGMPEANWYRYSNGPARGEQRDAFTGRLSAIAGSPERLEAFNKILERIVGRPTPWTIDEISAGQRYMKLKVNDQGFHNSEGMGEGLLSLFFIVAALLDSEPGTLVAIDEPELSLHPQLIRRLQAVLSEVSKDRQIVIATHSPLLVDWGDIENGATIARVHRGEAGSQISQAMPNTLARVARSSASHDLNQPHTLGSDAKEALFFEDHILLLEGQEDAVYLPRALNSLGLPEFPNVFGWGVGGADKMPRLALLLKELGFKRIGALLDNDGQRETLKALDELKALAPEVSAVMHPAPDIRNKPARFGPEGVTREEIFGLLDHDNRTVRPSHVEKFRAVTVALRRHLGLDVAEQ